MLYRPWKIPCRVPPAVTFSLCDEDSFRACELFLSGWRLILFFPSGQVPFIHPLYLTPSPTLWRHYKMRSGHQLKNLAFLRFRQILSWLVFVRCGVFGASKFKGLCTGFSAATTWWSHSSPCTPIIAYWGKPQGHLISIMILYLATSITYFRISLIWLWLTSDYEWWDHIYNATPTIRYICLLPSPVSYHFSSIVQPLCTVSDSLF